jgi:putative ABC transport system permease protein
MKNQNLKPPRIAEWILRRIANRGESEVIGGDLEEEYKETVEEKGIGRARLWYWTLILVSTPSFIKSHIYWSMQMFRNYLKIASRNIKRYKGYSFINISGLAIAIAAAFLIFLFVSFELSYDRFHDNSDRIYRVRNDRIYSDIHDKSSGCPPALSPTLKEEFPEIIESARVYPASFMSNVVSYDPSDSYIQAVKFGLKGFEDAGKVSVTGFFNNWDKDLNTLRRKGNRWEGEALLLPGRYAYKFVVDDKEILDPDNPDQVTYESGTYSLHIVKEPDAPSRLITFYEEKVFYAEPTFLKMFSFPMVKGFPESALEDPNTVVLSESVAKKYFRDENPVDKMIILTNQYGTHLCKITGVLKNVPENSHIQFDFLLSYKTLIQKRDQAAHYWGWNMFYTYVLLSPTANPQSLESKFPAFVERHKLSGDDYRREFILQPLRDIHLSSSLRWEPEGIGNSRTVYFLTIIAVFIMLIAWVNYINLSTARSMTRAREVGIRKVVGSRRLQLIKQFIYESVFVNILAVIFGLVLVLVFLRPFSRMAGLPLSMSPGTHVWIWLASAILTGAVLSAIYPALVLSSFMPVTVLKGLHSHSSKGMNFRKGLVIFQFAISIILIVGTLTVYKQLSFMRNQDLGVNIEQTMALRIPGPMAYSTDRVNRFKRALLDYPSIKAVCASSTIPGEEYSNAASGIRPLNSDPDNGKRCFFITVDYEYFDFYGIELLAGRKFSKEFSTDRNAAILNEEAVKIFGYESPEKSLNEKILLGGLGEQIVETVGVIKNYHHKSLKDSVQPIIFTLTEGDPNGRNNYFSVKLDIRNISATLSLVRDKWDEVFSGKPLDYFFINESFNNQYRSDQQFGNVFGLFAALSVFISCLGLFGLAAFMVEQRTKEIGIRRILGASASGIVFLLSKEFTKWVLVANIIAWPVAYYAMDRWLQNFAYRTGMGIAIFILSGLLAFIIAVITVSYQSIKIAITNPVDSLRYE